MARNDEVFSLPTKEQKDDYVLKEVSFLMDVFNVGTVEVSNLDQINLQVRMPADDSTVEKLELIANAGYHKEEGKEVALYHKFDDDTAVASNVSLDKRRKMVIISVNY